MHPSGRRALQPLCGHIEFRHDGTIDAADDDAAALLGASAAELCGWGLRRLLQPAAAVYLQLVVLPRLRLDGHAEELSLVLCGGDGSALPVLAALRQGDGAPAEARVRMAFMRAHRRHGVEDRLVQARQAAELVPGTQLRVERDGAGSYRLAYAGPGLQATWGVAAGGRAGGIRALWRAMHRGERRRVARAFGASRREGVLPPLTVRLHAADDQPPRWVALHATVRAVAPDRVRWQCTLHDVTLQQRLEVRLRELDKLQAVATLAAGAAHDFNNLLGSIRGLAELCEAEAEDGSRTQRRLRSLLGATERAAGLVRQLLDFAREESQQQCDTSLAELLQRCEGTLAASLPAGVSLACELACDAPLCVDTAQLEQCLLQLVSNAAHAMRGGGVVQLIADQAPWPAALPGGPGPPGPMARLRVIDRGDGMAPAVLARVFEPFFSTRPVGQGTGLGLSMVRGIVQAHGGDVLASSRPGQGSVFTLYLPLRQREAGAARGAAAAIGQAG